MPHMGQVHPAENPSCCLAARRREVPGPDGLPLGIQRLSSAFSTFCTRRALLASNALASTAAAS
jgi:hypothetical protein